ncbi:MAG: hypothetical protein ACOCQG_01800 [Candidatus Nanoarchaeia archaeon]
MKKLILFILFFSVAAFVNAFEITEIHPNLNENLTEPRAFVEVKTNDSLTNLSLQINKKNFTIKSIKNKSTDYSLVVSEEFNHEKLNCSIYLAEDGFENKLNETAGTITLYDKENVISSINYKNAKINNSLIEPWNISTEKSPCGINPAIENKSCKIEFSTVTDEKIYDYGDTIKINHIIKNHSNEFEISYWIEDLYGNIVKNNLTTTNTNQKRWTTNAKGEAFLIKSILKTNCSKNKEFKTKSTTPFIVRQEQESEKKESEIKINTIDGNTEFGKTFDIDLQIIKGDTRKYSINAYVKGENKVSETTNIHARGSNKEYRTKVPIAIRNNCEKNYEEGEHTLVIEGLGIKKEKEISIEDNQTGCVQIEAEEKEEQLETQIKINNIDKNIEFGKTFDIDLQITKGDTRKYSINAYVKGENKVGETTNIHVRGSNKEYRTKVPIAIRNNCEKNYEEGEHTLVIEGLGIKKEKEISIKDNQAGCTEKIIEKEVLIEPEPKPKIRSFYTLHQTFNEEINLYTTIENINKTKNATFISAFENKTIQIKDENRIKIPTKAKKGKNLYILDLVGHDTKYVEVDFTPEKEKASKPEREKNETKENSTSKGTKKGGNEEFNSKLNSEDKEKDKGNPEKLYQSSGERSKNTAKYFFMAVLAISIPYAIIKHRRKLYKTPFVLKTKWLNK